MPRIDPEDSRTGEFEERCKEFKRCDCLLSGATTTSGKQVRKSMGAWEWDQARAMVASWEGAPFMSLRALRVAFAYPIFITPEEKRFAK